MTKTERDWTVRTTRALGNFHPVTAAECEICEMSETVRLVQPKVK